MELNINSTSYGPSSQGILERPHREVGVFLSIFCKENPYIWDDHLGHVARRDRTPQISLRNTPFHLMKMRDALEPTDPRPPMRYRLSEDPNEQFRYHFGVAHTLANAYLVLAKDKQKEDYDQTASPKSFDVEYHILLKIMVTQTGKFYQKYTEPYIVMEKKSDVNYVVQLETGEGPAVMVHVDRMKKGSTDRIPIGPDELSDDPEVFPENDKTNFNHKIKNENYKQTVEADVHETPRPSNQPVIRETDKCKKTTLPTINKDEILVDRMNEIIPDETDDNATEVFENFKNSTAGIGLRGRNDEKCVNHNATVPAIESSLTASEKETISNFDAQSQAVGPQQGEKPGYSYLSG